jgi:hypothetical protein
MSVYWIYLIWRFRLDFICLICQIQLLGVSLWRPARKRIFIEGSSCRTEAEDRIAGSDDFCANFCEE